MANSKMKLHNVIQKRNSHVGGLEIGAETEAIITISILVHAYLNTTVGMEAIIVISTHVIQARYLNTMGQLVLPMIFQRSGKYKNSRAGS